MKERIITGVILALGTLVGIMILPTGLFAAAIFAVCIIALFEWENLLSLTQKKAVFILSGSALLLFSLVATLSLKTAVLYILIFIAYLWLLVPLLLNWHMSTPLIWLTNKCLLLNVSIIMLIGFLISLILLHEIHYGWVIYLIGLVAIADSGAYFIGRKFGKRKLAVTISPGKSIEGAIGGLIVASVFAFICALSIGLGAHFAQLLGFIVLSIVTVIVSVSGDLFESLVKRHRGIKDSGSILPGHGGILDRIDALVAAAPVFTCGLLLIFPPTL